MVDAPPGDVGDMQQAVDAAEIDESAVIGDVLDHALDDLALFEIGDDLVALLGAALFENRAARHDDIAAAAVHLEDLERLRHAHQRRHVADRADIDLRARQEGHGAVEIDGKAALHLIEDDAFDLLGVLEGLFELDPAFLAARLVARDDGLAERIFDALQIDLDLVADLERLLAARPHEFLEGDPPFGLQPDVDDGDILLEGDDGALDDGAFEGFVLAVALGEQCGKILARRREAGGGNGHRFSSNALLGRRRRLVLRVLRFAGARRNSTQPPLTGGPAQSPAIGSRFSPVCSVSSKCPLRGEMQGATPASRRARSSISTSLKAGKRRFRRIRQGRATRGPEVALRSPSHGSSSG